MLQPKKCFSIISSSPGHDNDALVSSSSAMVSSSSAMVSSSSAMLPDLSSWDVASSSSEHDDTTGTAAPALPLPQMTQALVGQSSTSVLPLLPDLGSWDVASPSPQHDDTECRAQEAPAATQSQGAPAQRPQAPPTATQEAPAATPAGPAELIRVSQKGAWEPSSSSSSACDSDKEPISVKPDGPLEPQEPASCKQPCDMSGQPHAATKSSALEPQEPVFVKPDEPTVLEGTEQWFPWLMDLTKPL